LIEVERWNMYAARLVLRLGHKPAKLQSWIRYVTDTLCKIFLEPLWETWNSFIGLWFCHGNLIKFNSMVLGQEDSKLALCYDFSALQIANIIFSRKIFSRV
jgi:hypothetical protein